LLTHKVLPSLSVLERFIARLRGRMEDRLWRSLAAAPPPSNERERKTPPNC